MSIRPQLYFNRSKDKYIKHYNVYRNTTPNVNKSSLRVMKIEHPLFVHPVTVEDISPHILSETNIQLPFQYILDDYDVIVQSGDTIIPRESYSVDYENGSISFTEKMDDINHFTVTSTFDGLQAVDDIIEQEGVVYYGPPAIDTSGSIIPDNLNINVIRDRAYINFNLMESGGTTYYYRIESVNKSNDYSFLSDPISVEVTDDIDFYRLEQSVDFGESWSTYAESYDTQYNISMLTNPPSQVPNAYETVRESIDVGRTEVKLEWDQPINTESSRTPMYRASAVSATGGISAYTTAGPVDFISQIQRVIIRRKIFNGSYPTFSGTDAITVADLDPTETSFIENIPNNEVYGYSIYTVDDSGNYSTAKTFKIQA